MDGKPLPNLYAGGGAARGLSTTGVLSAGFGFSSEALVLGCLGGGGCGSVVISCHQETAVRRNSSCGTIGPATTLGNGAGDRNGGE